MIGSGHTGNVCMQSLEVGNGSTKQKSISVTKFVKTGAQSTEQVEVLNTGEKLNLLDVGEAGDNLKVIRFDGTNGLDAASPMLFGRTGGEGCVSTDIFLMESVSGETTLGFKQGNDTVVVRAELNSVTTKDGSVAFAAELPSTLSLGRGWSFPPSFLGRGWSFPPSFLGTGWGFPPSFLGTGWGFPPE